MGDSWDIHDFACLRASQSSGRRLPLALDARGHAKRKAMRDGGVGALVAYFTTSVSQPGMRERNVDVDPIRA